MENLPDLYFAFDDRLSEDGKQQKIIKCKICCLRVPSYSTRAEVCEMCFDVDFWDYQKNRKNESADTMWAIKVVTSGIIGNYYYHKGHYWIGRREDATAKLGGATLYTTKDKAQGMLSIINNIGVKNSQNPPSFKIIQVSISEVDP